jgi:hypothetical protein
MMGGARAGLWGLFALCLTAGGLILLPACGLRLPLRLSSMANLQSRFCPVPLDRSAFLRASEARKVKEERIRKAELEIARIARCAPANPAAAQPDQPAGRT